MGLDSEPRRLLDGRVGILQEDELVDEAIMGPGELMSVRGI
jgi:hypothetical protein